MKFFAFSMAIFIFALGLTPCLDSMENEAYLTVCDKINDHHHDGEPNDDCTPFCTCACCGLPIPLLNSTNLLISKGTQRVLLPIPVYHFLDYQSGFTQSVWEPPRLS